LSNSPDGQTERVAPVPRDRSERDEPAPRDAKSSAQRARSESRTVREVFVAQLDPPEGQADRRTNGEGKPAR